MRSENQIFLLLLTIPDSGRDKTDISVYEAGDSFRGKAESIAIWKTAIRKLYKLKMAVLEMIMVTAENQSYLLRNPGFVLNLRTSTHYGLVAATDLIEIE